MDTRALNIREPEGYRIRIHQSLIRPRMLLGGERGLVILASAVPALTLACGDMRVVLGIGLPLWLIALAVLQRAARIDPELSEVYTRYLNHRAYTPAQPTLVAAAPTRKVQQ